MFEDATSTIQNRYFGGAIEDHEEEEEEEEVDEVGGLVGDSYG